MSRPLVGLMSVLAVLCTVIVGFAPAAAAQDYVPISGSGSTWSFNALDQWRKNVKQFGMKIEFSGQGSTEGRNQFKFGQVDFAVSEIPYGLTDRNIVETKPADGTYAYMPIVAGGTSFMYNLNIAGKRITNLRLSGEVVTKIFTGVITNWSDPAIKADNPNLALPARKIVPVVRSDGSGSTAQFTSWMAAQHGKLWDDYCRRAGRTMTPCGFTSSYPVIEPIVAQDKSNGVANYVRQGQSDGAITYVEYSYAKNAGFPVAKLLNAKGYYIAPTAEAVAVALLRAQIRPDLTQDLSQVYGDMDARTYPLSSYSYMIIPTVPSAKFSQAKGRTLSDFAYYFLCEGQQQAQRLGFSPLPINLVRAGLDQVARIPGSTKKPTDIGKCNNPTFSADGTNTLAVTAKPPPECDRRGGPAQCTEAGVPAKSATNGQAAAAGPVVPGDAAPGEAAPAEVVDAATGETRSQLAGGSASAVPVSVDLPQDDGTLLIVVALVLLTALVVGPPLVARLLRKTGVRQ
ncbi:phosphate ABC transporter substrate-binding protein PstS [Actinokineospora sp.]|uniref:phosphate ABC transporter substrate-binding protein PstS n=1 Tax=Actinokineospora sp. TaxID=1872133 RepID=UPI003D6AD73B